MAAFAYHSKRIVRVALDIVTITSEIFDGFDDVPKEIASLTSNLESLVAILRGIQEDDTLNNMAFRKQSLLPLPI
jgi:predicted Zn-dependent protease with MMP-like domain